MLDIEHDKNTEHLERRALVSSRDEPLARKKTWMMKKNFLVPLSAAGPMIERSWNANLWMWEVGENDFTMTSEMDLLMLNDVPLCKYSQ